MVRAGYRCAGLDVWGGQWGLLGLSSRDSGIGDDIDGWTRGLRLNRELRAASDGVVSRSGLGDIMRVI